MRLRRRVLHRGRKFDFELLEFASADGKPVVREIVRHRGSAVIVPRLPDGRLVLIRSYRPAIERELWELPAGTLEPGEPPQACAARELLEETGYRAGRLTPLARFYPSPGLTDEIMWAFLGTDLAFEGQRLEEDERVTTEAVPVEEALTMIDDGRIEDGKTIAALLMARRRGLL